MANFSTFYWGMLAFFICCAVGFCMSFAGGFVIDSVHSKMIDAPGHDSNFAIQTESQVYWFINLYYLVMYAIPIIGGLIFGQSILKKVRETDYVYR